MASTFLTSQTLYSRVLVAAFCAITVILVAVFRVVLRNMHRRLRAGRFDLKRVAIVGGGADAERLARRIVSHREIGYDLAGLVSTGGGPRPTGFPMIGTFEDLPRLIEEQRIGEVIFADPSLSNEDVADFLLTARRSTVDVKMVSGLAGILTQRARVEEFLDLPVVSFEREALLKTGAGAKRALDVVGAILLVIVWAPFLGVTALVNAVRGRAPFERSPRAGRDGTRYEMLVPNETTRPSPLRRFLTRHGLSRFPAILNVVAGEMSFVGPKPVAPERFDSFDTRERLRFDARPGLTGLSEVSAEDGDGSTDEGRALDVYYVQNWSLGGDLKILLRWLARCVGGRAG